MAALDCRHLICLGGVGTVAANYEELGPVLSRIGRVARKFGIRAAYHNGRTRETIADMKTALDHADPEVVFAACDTGHATRDFIEFPYPERAVRFMEREWDRIDFIEFKDWSPSTELNTPVGEGLCDWPAVFERVVTGGYGGWIVVEQNGHPGLSKGRTPFECARLSREFIRKGMSV